MAFAFFAGMVLLLSMYAAPPPTDTAAVEHIVPLQDAEAPEAPDDETDLPRNVAVAPLATAAKPRQLEPEAAERPLRAAIT